MKGLIILTVIMLFSGCSIEEADFDEYRSTVTVSGWVSNEEIRQSVVISYSAPFGSSNIGFPIEDAQVAVKSGDGKSFTYQYLSDGKYQSTEEFGVENGISYFIEIRLSDGGIIRSRAESILNDVSIDSMAYDFTVQESTINPGFSENVYFPIAFAKDPASIDNFYRWKLYKNDSLFSGSESLIILSDRFFDGNAYQNDFVNFEYSLEDKITVELIEISPGAFTFLSQLKAQTGTFGFNSSVSPSPISGNLFYTNLEDEVLGFFGVTSLDRESIIISD